MSAATLQKWFPTKAHVEGHSETRVNYYPSTASTRYTFRVLFCRWRGSLYKLVWRDLVIWIILYYTLIFIYRFVLDDEQKSLYAVACQYCQSKNSKIPVSLVLVVYVGLVAKRWWVAWDNIPWPDEYLFWIAHCVRGEQEELRVIRRTLARYWNLATVYCFTLLSPRVRKRFPTLDQFSEAGLLNDSELQIIQRLREKTDQKLYYIPMHWASMLLIQLYKEKHITDFNLYTIQCTLLKLRTKCSNSLMKDVKRIPLVFPQVAAWGVYFFAGLALLGNQFTNVGRSEDGPRILYVPLITICEIMFFFGWLKVSEAMMDPYGDDDDDLPLNLFIDSNVQESYLMMDKALRAEYGPELVKDLYWNEVVPRALPHTAESAAEASRNEDVDPTGSMPDLPDDRVELEEQQKEMAKEHRKRTTVRRIMTRVIGGHPRETGMVATRRRSTKKIRLMRVNDQGVRPGTPAVDHRVIAMNEYELGDKGGGDGETYRVPQMERIQRYEKFKDLLEKNEDGQSRANPIIRVESVAESGETSERLEQIVEVHQDDSIQNPEGQKDTGCPSTGKQMSQDGTTR